MSSIDYGKNDDWIWVGDGIDGCYVKLGEAVTGWFVTVTVDCETGSFCEDVHTDFGPFGMQSSAKEFGVQEALDWCLVNGVDAGDWEELQ